MFLMTILFFGCSATTSVDFELGYEDGCAFGAADATSCNATDSDFESIGGSDYARGLSSGYKDCYEAWSEVTDC